MAGSAAGSTADPAFQVLLVSFGGNHVSSAETTFPPAETTFPLAETMSPHRRLGTCLLGARTNFGPRHMFARGPNNMLPRSVHFRLQLSLKYYIPLKRCSVFLMQNVCCRKIDFRVTKSHAKKLHKISSIFRKKMRFDGYPAPDIFLKPDFENFGSIFLNWILKMFDVKIQDHGNSKVKKNIFLGGKSI